jgi:hypothetical protein
MIRPVQSINTEFFGGEAAGKRPSPLPLLSGLYFHLQATGYLYSRDGDRDDD